MSTRRRSPDGLTWRLVVAGGWPSMTSYTYSAYLWPAFFSTALIAVLGWYAWRRRSVPGALPFAIGCLFAALWSAGAILETAAADPSAKIWWLKFQTLWHLPVISAATCFILEFAGLGRWVNRRLVAALSIPALAFALLILTSGGHTLAWTDFLLADGRVQPVRGPFVSLGLGYSYLLGLFNLGLMIWLVLTSPRHRWPAGLMVLGQLGSRTLFELRMAGDFPAGWDADPFVLGVLFTFYGVALFRFHVFDPVPAARTAVIEQMLEGMVVLDLDGRIADVNGATARILGMSAQDLRGRPAEEVLPGSGSGITGTEPDAPTEWELELEAEGGVHHYTAQASMLRDHQGLGLGKLLLLHDVTEQKKAQARLLEQERVVAVLEERERLARELHDGVGQVLGYVSLQAESVRKRLQDGEAEKTDAMLARLAAVAQEAHGEVRRSIHALTAGTSEEWSFLPTVESYLQDFRAQYGLETKLRVAEGVSESSFSPQISVQLLRVIQEALNNARAHAGACTVRVTIEQEDGHARITVEDDGCGFDPAGVGPDRRHFGLAFMRDRMSEIGGSLRIESRPGAGTLVDLAAPIRRNGGEA